MRTLALIALLLCSCLAQAQPGKTWRIGVLETTSIAMNAANLGAFRKGLRELCYVEGKNLVIEYRTAEGRAEKFNDLAAELMRAKVDVIVTRGTPATQAAKTASNTVPIVAAAFGDPVGSGFAKSLSRPGGNITGLSSATPDLAAKRVHLLKETLPKAVRVGVLANLSNGVAAATARETQTAAQLIGLQATVLDVRKPEDLPRAFEAASKQQLAALVVLVDGLIQANARTIIELAAKHRLPAVYSSREFVDAGGLMSVGVSYPQLYYRAAAYVDKIFKGAKAGELPIEERLNVEVVINVKTANGLAIPLSSTLKLRADVLVQ